MSLAIPVATTLATTLLLIRDQPDKREAGAAAFRVLLAALSDQPLRVRVRPDGLEVQGERIPPETPGIADLRAQLLGHGVGLVELPPKLSPAAVLTVLRALAQPRGRFRSLDALLEDIEPATRPLIRLGPPVEPDESFRAHGDYIAGDDVMQTLVAVEGGLFGAATGVPLEIGDDKMGHAHLAAAVTGRLEDLLRDLEAAPDAPEAPARVNAIIAACDAGVRREQFDDARRAAGLFARLEERVGEGELRRVYGIAIRRLTPRPMLEHLAKRTALGGAERTEALDILRKVGSEASEALLRLLADSDDLDDRRAYYAALRQVATVSPLFARLLGNEEWYVLRNVAELCGDLRADEMVPNLARHTQHEDERVRRAVAGALAKIASPGAVEPLRQMLRDPAPQVRLQAVQGLHGTGVRGLAMPLALAADEETNADVLREIYHALGRIGTPDAVQVLSRAAERGKLFKRRPLATRLAAIEGLRLAATPAAASALQSLLADGDREIRDAAQDALALM